MIDEVYDPNWTAKVTVPVRRVGTKWEFFYGGDVPVHEGTIGNLVIPIAQIMDKAFLKMVSDETVVKILDEGTKLLVALSDRGAGMRYVRVGRPWPDVPIENMPPGTTRFEQIVIGPPNISIPRQRELVAKKMGGGLWIRLKGLERSELECSTVHVPEEVSHKDAVSLNHALTLLSQHYETHRISHTGNVYERVFYQEENNKWYPIGHLREGVRARAERSVIASVWDRIEEKLGWCQLIPEPKPINGRRRSRK
ncbi:hypothetical protein SAMN05216299_109115 [Nitrosospira sp. Nsp14]|uniref:hypothetical protein n=1 Tax=Nitrosospira sp. Nsp14 TaxID=1855333 RepID=UPI0008E73146|nr:hypothetical protein [Nitrosospira sp. Nsp14]SFH38256.1 hypothetical protein SAMN05216299_109115 [Nitrosospira sp. Nsp14]